MSCPRCVRPIAPDAPRCPNCGYDVPAPVTRPSAMTTAVPSAAPRLPSSPPPPPPPPRAGPASPWAQTGVISPVGTEDYSPIPGLIEQRPQVKAPARDPRRRWWAVLGVLAGSLTVCTVIALVAARRNHPEAANTGAPPTPTGATHPAASAPGSPGTSTAPSRTSSATHQLDRAQASAIDRYLTQSGQARRGVGPAISAISSCTNVSSAVSALQNAANVRSRIVGALASSDVSALPNGATAVSHLREAMQASADADLHYAGWGRAVAGCHGHALHNADFAAAQQSDTVATAAKQQFATAWKPIAATYGLPKQDAGTF
jgi:hypothetical protein